MNEDMEKMLQEAPAPTLTLEPFAEEKEEPAVVEKEEAVQPVDEKEKIKAILTPQEQKQVCLLYTSVLFQSARCTSFFPFRESSCRPLLPSPFPPLSERSGTPDATVD